MKMSRSVLFWASEMFLDFLSDLPPPPPPRAGAGLVDDLGRTGEQFFDLDGEGRQLVDQLGENRFGAGRDRGGREGDNDRRGHLVHHGRRLRDGCRQGLGMFVVVAKIGSDDDGVFGLSDLGPDGVDADDALVGEAVDGLGGGRGLDESVHLLAGRPDFSVKRISHA